MRRKLVEFRFHRRVVFRKALDAQIFRLVVCKPQVVFRRKQGLLCLLKMVDRFVDFIDCAVEPFTRQTEIPIEFLFKIIHIFLKMGNVNILIFDDSKLLLIPQRIQEALRSSVIIGIKNCGRITYIFGYR